MTRAMKQLLAKLAADVATVLRPPAEPRALMEAFCQAMGRRRGRPIQLVFREFPADVPVTGLRLDCGDRSIIVVEDRTPAESQLVILGHELYHEEQGGCGHHVPGLPAAAARALTAGQNPDAAQRAAEQFLAAHEVSRDTLLAIAARADSVDPHEQDAETFGLLFGRELRAWLPGHYAQGAAGATSLEGRIQASLLNRNGQVPR